MIGIARFVVGKSLNSPGSLITIGALILTGCAVPETGLDSLPPTTPPSEDEIIVILPAESDIKEGPALSGPEESDVCADGPNKNPNLQPKIFYGTNAPTVVPISLPQTWAIGTFGGCSGLLITPTWVLSASHCNFHWEGGDFCIGKNPDNADRCIPVETGYDHPYADLSVVELAWDARTSLPGVEPIPILTEDMDDSWLGKIVEAAGYGGQENDGYGTRRFSAEPIAWLDDNEVTVDGKGQHGACFGDSGGPLLALTDTAEVRVIGALSNGDDSCVGLDNYTRIDNYRTWIEDRTGPTLPPGPQPCIGIDAKGVCNPSSTQATYCGEDNLIHIDVCATGERCSWSDLGWRCVENELDVCMGMTYRGSCSGNVLTWCDEGGLFSRDCGACGETCVPNEASGYLCVKSSCGELTYQGKCDGDVAVWCNRVGEVESNDCGDQDKSCDYVDEEMGYWCAEPGCGAIDFKGHCEGTVAEWCGSDDDLEHIDCAEHGQACGLLNDEQGYYCLPYECGDIDFFGACDGDIVNWCNRDGELEQLDCGESNQNCGLLNSDLGYYCVN